MHVDQLEELDKRFKQYLVMQAMDPVFVLMSSTPYFLGRNTKKDHRVNTYRYMEFKDFPLHGQLLDYPKSMQDAYDRQKTMRDEWWSVYKRHLFGM